MSKLALVMHGGGMRGAYGAGFVDALIERAGYESVSMAIGTSAGAANAFGFAAQKRDALKDVWTHLLHLGTFIRLARIKWVTDTDFLMQLIASVGITNQEALISPTRLFIAATHYQTGEPHFFTNRDEVCSAVHASLSMPILCRTPIAVRGEDYLDGGISSTTGSLIKKAFSEGASRVIALDLSLHLQWINRAGLRWYARGKAPGLKRAIAHMITGPYPEPLAPDPRVFLIRPHHLTVSRLTHTPYSLLRAYELGRRETMENEKLKKFIELDYSL